MHVQVYTVTLKMVHMIKCALSNNTILVSRSGTQTSAFRWLIDGAFAHSLTVSDVNASCLLHHGQLLLRFGHLIWACTAREISDCTVLFTSANRKCLLHTGTAHACVQCTAQHLPPIFDPGVSRFTYFWHRTHAAVKDQNSAYLQFDKRSGTILRFSQIAGKEVLSFEHCPRGGVLQHPMARKSDC